MDGDGIRIQRSNSILTALEWQKVSFNTEKIVGRDVPPPVSRPMDRRDLNPQ